MVRNAFCSFLGRALNFATPEISPKVWPAQIRKPGLCRNRPRVPFFLKTPKQQYVYCALALFLVFTEAAPKTGDQDGAII